MNDIKNILSKTINVSVFILIFSLYISFSALINLLLKKMNIDIKNMEIVPKTITMILIQLLFVIILYLIYHKELKKEFKEYKKNFKTYFRFSIKYWVIGLIIMIISNIVLSFIAPNGATNEIAVQNALKQYPVYILISTSLLAPFTEEIIFRKALKKCFSNDFLFILTSGLIFGGIHVITSSSTLGYLYIIPYGTFGVVFGYMYVKTKNIFTSTLVHMIHNTLLVTISILTMGVI